MTILARFMAYAADFEQTFVDDDWRRLEPYFKEDAVYEVSGLPQPCVIRGRDDIFRGIKKSLDGFDRRMDRREIQPGEPPLVEDGRITLRGSVRYEKKGLPDLELRATIVVEYDGELISRMHDQFSLDPQALEWFGRYGAGLDGSYV